MGFFDKLKKNISLKNASPAGLLGSGVVKKGKKVIKTGKLGVKDAVDISLVGVGVSTLKGGDSNKKNPKSENKTLIGSDIFVDDKKQNQSQSTQTTTSVEKKKNNNLLYVGIGVGILLIGGFLYKMNKKK
jgi:hypothetical protein